MRDHRVFPQQKLIPLAFFLSFAYWIYLFFASQMFISADALGFEQLGAMVYKQGWIEFLKTGPNREPLYPLTIAISMRLSDFLQVPYQAVQKILQILVLFVTQFLLYRFLKKLKISDELTASALLYCGFSPAIVNSAFSLFSEILAYPFILWIVLTSASAWQKIPQAKPRQMMIFGCSLAILFVLLTLVKAIAEFVFFIFLIPFCFCVLWAAVKRQRKQLYNSLIFLIVAILTAQTCLTVYKKLNQKYNGHLAITDRGSWIIYGCIDRRTEQLTTQKFLSGLAYIHGEGLCQGLFNTEECDFWSFKNADGRGLHKFNELQGKMKGEPKIDSQLTRLASSKVLENPIQFFGLTVLENLKTFFWETTRLGFVAYPAWLEKLFDFVPFKNGLRLFVYLASLFSFFYLLFYSWCKRKEVLRPADGNPEGTCLIFFLLVFLISYSALYSFFYIIVRYIIPLAPLQIAGIAFAAQKILSKKEQLPPKESCSQNTIKPKYYIT